MRSLFWKIFLWFWLAMTLVITLTATLMWSLGPMIPRFPNEADAAPNGRRFLPVSEAMALLANQSVTAYQHAGAGALPPQWETGSNARRVESWLFDQNGKVLAHTAPALPKELTQKTTPAATSDAASGNSDDVSTFSASTWPKVSSTDIETMAWRALNSPRLQTRRQGSGLLAAIATDRAGQHFALVMLFSAPPQSDENPLLSPSLGFPILTPLLGAGDLSRRATRLLLMLLTTGLFCFWLARHLTRPVSQLRTATHQLERGQLSSRVAPQLKKRRDELGDLGRDFDAMAERLEALMTAQRRLISDVSHELRSPLARLGIALELARRHSTKNIVSQNFAEHNSSTRSSTNLSATLAEATSNENSIVPASAVNGATMIPAALSSADAQLQSALDRIEREAGRLEEMVGQLLMLSRLESGAPVGNEETFDLLEVVREVASDGRFEAQSQGREVEVTQGEVQGDCASSEQLPIHGSRALMRSGLENVLRNAIRFAPPGTSVQIEVHCETLNSRALSKTMPKTALEKLSPTDLPTSTHHPAHNIHNATSQIVLRVLDAGPGVPEDVLQKLFQPFYRVEDARDRQSGGTGLGLAIAERAIHLHDGTIRAFNRPAGGLGVEITLPQS